MKQNTQLLQNLHDDVRLALDPVSDKDEASSIIFKYKNDIEELGEDAADFFESHWGFCCEIDDALIDIFPSTFASRA